MNFKRLELPNLESVLSRMRPGATSFPECDVFVIYNKRYNSKKYDHSFKDKKSSICKFLIFVVKSSENFG